MKIKDMYNKKIPLISFEIFPPKKETNIESIYNTIDVLSSLEPDFISVTYGAGGSNDNKTMDIASIIKNKYNIEALAHLTCINSTKDDIENTLNNLNENNINNILALRGDFPSDSHKSDKLEYKYASDLIKHIKSKQSFSIGAACYPEGHIECKNLREDLLHLKQKVSTGAEFLITQLFFDNEYFYSFNEKIKELNINVPISIGIMPVTNKNQLLKMISLCGADLPNRFIRILTKYEYNPEALKEAGIAYATEQIVDLLSYGADGIHIYTMNNPEIAKKILSNISYIRKENKIS
ncbi:MAG: methylenetetrahydrofolate reductase [NAD(P)H] [Clostridium sp.]|uniref:methylenetetrahydrofolate reductase [NAD(P)H] n=1 Tax=Clostridium sp. TaxID=1506 RepID=UPI0039ED851D